VSGLRGAIQFLTRVPIRTSHAVPHERIVPWFGIVGALIGAVVGGVAVGLGELVPTGVAAGCAVVVGLLVTGAFHEDGLADIADAFGGGHDVERRLEILKDPRHGTYGVAALASSVVLRVVAAASIASASAVLVAFVAAHSIGRLAAVAAMKVAPPAVESGLGASAGRSLRAVPTSIGAGAALAIVAALAGWWVGPFLIAGVVAVVAVVILAMRKIGGIAGDVLGAVEQVAECLVLIVASGLAARHTVWWA
jgi:adenosylcobinamide-GDP ribazoletransferase